MFQAKKESSREVEEALETAGLEDETGGDGDNKALNKAALKVSSLLRVVRFS